MVAAAHPAVKNAAFTWLRRSASSLFMILAPISAPRASKVKLCFSRAGDKARNFMADSLYLSLWFDQFSGPRMMAHALSVMRQLPFSGHQPGMSYLALHPVSWNEPTILERRFRPGIDPEEAVQIASDLLHDDYAYLFEAYWDLWILSEAKEWMMQPSLVKFVVQGEEFDEGVFEQEGHIQVDFGLDSPFLHEGIQLTSAAEAKVRANVQQLVEFTTKVEKNSGARSRLLWSESEENLAQKLIMRLQKVQ